MSKSASTYPVCVSLLQISSNLLLDASNKCVKVSHPLKLFQQRSEWYDEIIFVNPNPVLAGLLANTRAWKQGAWTHETDFQQMEKDTLKSIDKAQSKCSELIEEVTLSRASLTDFYVATGRPGEEAKSDCHSKRAHCASKLLIQIILPFLTLCLPHFSEC